MDSGGRLSKVGGGTEVSYSGNHLAQLRLKPGFVNHVGVTRVNWKPVKGVPVGSEQRIFCLQDVDVGVACVCGDGQALTLV